MTMNSFKYFFTFKYKSKLILSIWVEKADKATKGFREYQSCDYGEITKQKKVLGQEKMSF